MSKNIWGEDVLDSKDYSDEDSVLYKGDLLESYDQESNNEFILNRKKFKQSLLSVETKIRLIEFPNSGSGQDIQPIQTVNPYWIQKNNFTIIASLDTSSSNAVRQFTLNPQDFKMDCNGYSSAILVAAIEDTLGAELFNKYIETNKNLTGNELVFATDRVTGFIVKDIWADPMGEKYLLNQRGDKKLQANKVLQKIEIGTVINVISPFLRNTAYHKENIIKVGNDNYFAQGLGVGVLSFRQVINGLVDKAIQYQLINESQRKKALEAIYVGTVIEWDLIVK